MNDGENRGQVKTGSQSKILSQDPGLTRPLHRIAARLRFLLNLDGRGWAANGDWMVRDSGDSGSGLAIEHFASLVLYAQRTTSILPGESAVGQVDWKGHACEIRALSFLQP
jgi:hypothetical protein